MKNLITIILLMFAFTSTAQDLTLMHINAKWNESNNFNLRGTKIVLDCGNGAGYIAAPKLLKKLGKDPLLDLGMRLGEASGAAVALGIFRCALAAHNGMATFEEAAVSEHVRS